MHLKSLFTKLITLMSIALALVACGGGSSSGGNATLSSSSSSSSQNSSASSLSSSSSEQSSSVESSSSSSSSVVIVDHSPEPFSFPEQSDAAPNSNYQSLAVTLAGIDPDTPISISNGEYSIDDTNFTSLDSLVSNGQTLTLRVESAINPSSQSVATITVGDYATSFVVTTRADIEAPKAKITFPSGNATEQYSVTTVSGTASDDYQVMSVEVNGIPATTNNNFHTWTARVPLQPGLNDLSVSVTDLAGNTVNGADSGKVDFQSYLAWPAAVTISGTTAYSFDNDYDSLFSVNLETGIRELISDELLGSGPNLLGVNDLVLDSSNNRLIVIDAKIDAVLAVDLNTGNRTILSDENTGTGVGFNAIRGFYHDIPNNRLIAADWAASHLVIIDLATGNRSVISGSGPVFDKPYDVAVDKDNNIAYVPDKGLNALFSINLETGERIIISSENVGSGETIASPTSAVLDKNNNRIFVLNSWSSASPSGKDYYDIIAVDLSTGDRTLVSGEGASDTIRGEGPATGLPTDIAMDESGERLLLSDFGEHRFTWIDISSGDRTTLTTMSGAYTEHWGERLTSSIKDKVNNRLLIGRVNGLYTFGMESGEGQLLLDRTGIEDGAPNNFLYSALSGDTESLYIGVNLPLEITRFNTETGDHELVFAELLEEPSLYGPMRSMVVSPEEDYLYYLTSSSYTLVQLNLQTGERKALASPSVGTGATLRYPKDIFLDNKNNRIYVVDDSDHSFYSVDTKTFERTVITSHYSGVSSGPSLGLPVSVDIDLDMNRAMVLDWSNDGNLVDVNLDSGDRSIISNPENNGPSIDYTDELVLDLEHHSAYVVDDNNHRMIQIDLISGDRVVFYP